MFRTSLFRKLIRPGVVLTALLMFGSAIIVGCNTPVSTAPEQSVPVVGSTLRAQAALKLPNPCPGPQDVDLDLGDAGGTLNLCGNSLYVPPSAVAARVHFHMHFQKGDKNTPSYVKFTPEGLKFPAGTEPILTLNTDGAPAGSTPFVAYVDDHGKVLEVLPTYASTAHTISAQLHHFSGYAVDW